VGYLGANLSLPGPLCSRPMPDVCDRQTDVRQTLDVRQHHRLMPSPIKGGGIIIQQTVRLHGAREALGRPRGRRESGHVVSPRASLVLHCHGNRVRKNLLVDFCHWRLNISSIAVNLRLHFYISFGFPRESHGSPAGFPRNPRNSCHRHSLHNANRLRHLTSSFKANFVHIRLDYIMWFIFFLVRPLCPKRDDCRVPPRGLALCALLRQTTRWNCFHRLLTLT